ncbi:MAG: DNRLRE domain-containing protein, partial [Bacteroidota bacterium]
MPYNYLRLISLFITILGLHLCLTAQIQTTISFEPSKDNTLYESADGSLSNGSGNHIFAGKTGIGTVRRAVLKFDLSSIPANASIDRVSLEMNVSKSAGAVTDVQLIALRQDWGEGSSDADGPEGMGTTAESGDATWLHRVYPNQRWTNAGGDFMPIATATTTISGTGKATWNDPFMTMDVQAWIEAPAENFGWLVQGDESNTTTANRFDSRESANPPVLRITYTVGNDDDDNGDDDDDNGDDDDDNGDDDDDNGDDDDDNGDDDIANNIAMIQLIHNSPDPIVSAINIDVNGRMLRQNFGFRSATEFF